MRPRRLIWQLFPSFLLVTVLALAAVSWYVSDSLNEFYLLQTARDLEARARLVAQQVSGRSTETEMPYFDRLSKELGRRIGTRITLILSSGRVVGDSAEEPDRMENHADRPEVATALAGRVGRSVRFSHTLQKKMMYVAVPVESRGVRAVRVALPLDAIDTALWNVYRRIALGGLGVAVLAGALSFLVGMRISRPLEKMRRGARRFAEGDLQERLTVSGSEEICALAEAMNVMAGQLDERMRLVVAQRNEKEAMLASMVEGVVAVDTDERILRLNAAAGRLLGVTPEEAEGRCIQEVIRKFDMQRFITRALESPLPLEGDIVLHGPEEDRFLQAHGTPLRDAGGRNIGALIVLNDVTRLHRLERVRRDFVANVSHELKTPITAIKGFIETLRDGAIDDPEAGRRFLEIVARQADRLNAIIEDLLDLARIELGVERREIPLQPAALEEVLRGAVHATVMQAAARNIRIDLDCPPGLQARINPPLLEQAVVNLIDNAVKYSPSGGRVLVAAEQAGGEIVIRVQDWGSGIERHHLPRLFERFYRVDKARSRKEGGTGLGLAIVKHISQAHGGRVVVQSTPGQGSIFTLHLPA